MTFLMKLFCISVPAPNVTQPSEVPQPVQQQQTPAAVAVTVPTIPPGQNVPPAPVAAGAEQPAAPPAETPAPVAAPANPTAAV